MEFVKEVVFFQRKDLTLVESLESFHDRHEHLRLSLPVLVSAHPGEHTESLELSKLPSIVLHLSRHRLLNQ